MALRHSLAQQRQQKNKNPQAQTRDVSLIIRAMETSTLDLLYLESDPSTEMPSACVYMKAGARQDYAGVTGDKLLTSRCLSFIELDAEIRRLHAELEEIRARARKNFYRAEAAALGAA